MLQDFLSTHRDTLIARCRSKVAMRLAPRATEHEIGGIPLFLDHLIDTLRLERAPAIPATSSVSDIGWIAAQHGSELLRRGYSVGQVVHVYGDLYQAINDQVIEQNAIVPEAGLRTLNRRLVEAIAGAVTEFGRQRDALTSDEYARVANQHVGALAHELRNLIGTAVLAIATIRKGGGELTGATGALLDRSLSGVRDLVDRTLVDVRLSAGLSERRERIVVADFIEEVQLGAAIEAATRDLAFVVSPIEEDLAVDGDREILAAAVTNVLQNAVKFTRPRGRVSLNTCSVADRILIGIADECGGIPEGKAEEIFRPFEQASAERTGLGLGLPISRRGVEANGGTLHVRNLPGTGCLFTIDLPRAAPALA